ncbi:MAG: PDZ domain-containing protein [Provencibacterium sp.]|jgi:serine protease Do|nr:PDZ domain-containing protein [Provencibacterium sp.]
MTYYDDFKQDSYNLDQSLENCTPEKGGRSPKGRSRASAAALVAVCAVFSSLTGFGGGYLAANMNRVSVSEEGASLPAPAMDADASAASLSSGPALSGGAQGETMSVAQIVNAVSDSVVEIRTEVTATNDWGMQMKGEAAGSGVILTTDGYIATNNHVVEDAQSISVRLANGERYDASLVGTDAQTDLAVLKIEAQGLSAAAIGDSDALQVGEEAVAIGNPLGELGGTVTNGIVSALDREVTIDGETMNLLQTNAAINPGNSGGGLFNSRGELIGIVVAKSSGSGVEGLGFAIPVNEAKAVVDDLIRQGYVGGRGELGISIVDVQDARTALYYRVNEPGTYVAQVQDGSAAAAAGMKVGDRIVSIDGTEITDSDALRAAVKAHGAGERLSIEVSREGTRLTLSVTLQEVIPETAEAKEA